MVTSSFGLESGQAIPPPFSIITGNFKDLGGDDRAYNDFRNHVIAVVDGEHKSKRLGRHQLVAGRALKHLVRMSSPEIGYEPTQKLITEARSKGIEVIPGKGITFADIPAIEAHSNPADKECLVRIDPYLVDYLYGTTNTVRN